MGKEKSYISYFNSPIGIIEILADENAILHILFLDDVSESILDNADKHENVITRLAKQQLHDYFFKDKQTFSLPLHFFGTTFQHKVWQRLQQIPFGKTISYQQLSIHLGDEKCIRAAASANGKNPFAIVVPCHRVIGKNGTLTGYAGGLWRKQWLLEHEHSFAKQPLLF